MASVAALVDSPLSEHEALVIYATAIFGAPRSDMATITGLTEAEVTAAIAQLTRRGLIRHPAGLPRSLRPRHVPQPPDAA